MLNPLKQNFNATVSVNRLTTDADTANGEEYAAHLASVPCLIVPLEESFGNDLEGSFGKDFQMFCETVDIVEGDRVVNGSTQYRVTGVRAYEFMGNELMDIRIREFAA